MHTVRVSALRLCVVSSAQRAPDPACATGRDLAGLGPGRPVPPHSSGLSHVLLVTTSVRVIHGVHCHTSHDGPLVSLSLCIYSIITMQKEICEDNRRNAYLVLVVGSAGLEQRLVCAAASCDQADHGPTVIGDGLLGTGRQADASHTLVTILRDNDSVIARGTGHLSTISRFGFDIANHRTFGNLLAREDVSDC